MGDIKEICLFAMKKICFFVLCLIVLISTGLIAVMGAYLASVTGMQNMMEDLLGEFHAVVLVVLLVLLVGGIYSLMALSVYFLINPHKTIGEIKATIGEIKAWDIKASCKKIWQGTKEGGLVIVFGLLGLGIIGGLIWAIWSFSQQTKEEWGQTGAIIAVVIGYFTLQSQLDKISREQKEQSVQLGVIRENLSKLLERK